MSRPAVMVIGVLLLAIGVALGLVAHANGWINWPPKSEVGKQVPGEPPVTVSDGSLHAHSMYGWTSDMDGDNMITPSPANNSTGQYSTSCGLTVPDSHGNPIPVSGLVWTDDESRYDISPTAQQASTVTIIHDPKGTDQPNDDAQVVIAASMGSALQIYTHKGSFHESDGKSNKQKQEGRYNRRHSRAGDVQSIQIQSAAVSKTWTPSNTQNPHFTVAFCYQ